MGGLCGCCDRRALENRKGLTIYDLETDDSKQSFWSYLEASHPYQSSEYIYKENKFTKIMNSAASYWSHRDKMTLFGSHRVVSSYKLNKNKGIYKINNIIVTQEEMEALRKIEKFYCTYKKKKVDSDDSMS